MTYSNSGWILQIEGLPANFSTQGVKVAGLPTHNDLFIDNMIEGALVPPKVEINEKSDLLEGNYECSGLTFEILEVPTGNRTNSGSYGIGSYLFNSENLYSATYGDVNNFELGSDLPITASTIDLKINWTSYSGLVVPVSSTIYLDGETIKLGYPSLIGTIQFTNYDIQRFTIIQRGAFKSQVKNHYIDEYNNYFPTINVEYVPYIQRRKVLLFRYDSIDNLLKCIWRGFVNNGPKLSQNGISWQLECDSLWVKNRNESLGVKNYKPRICGFDRDNIRLGLGWQGNNFSFFASLQNARPADQTSIIISEVSNDYAYTLKECIDSSIYNNVRYLVSSQYGPNLGLNDFFFGYKPVAGNKIELETALARDNVSAEIVIGVGQNQIREKKASETKDASTYSHTFITFDQPAAVHPLKTNTSSERQYIHIDDINQLPVTTGSWTISGSQQTALSRDIFILPIDDDFEAKIVPVTTYNNNDGTRSSNAYAPAKMSAYVQFQKTKVDSPNIDYDIYTIFSNKEMQYAKSITATHWMNGIRYGLVGPYLDYSDWAWPDFQKIIAYSSAYNGFRQANWQITPATKIGDIITNYCKAFFCSPASTVDGKLTIKGFNPPSKLSGYAIALTKADFLAAPSYADDMENLVNKVVFKSALIKGGYQVINQTSISRYGASKTLEIDLSSFTQETELAQNTTSLTRLAQTRIFNIFSEPLKKIRLTIKPTYFESIFIGDNIKVTDWLIPNGKSGRGYGNLDGNAAPIYVPPAIAIVIGKTRNYVNNQMIIEALIWPGNNHYCNYSPSFRISAIDAANKNVTLTTAYLTDSTTATTYAGTLLGATTEYGADSIRALKNGVTVFLAKRGDERADTRIKKYEELIVDYFDEATGKLYFTTVIPSSPVDWAAALTAGYIIDVEYAVMPGSTTVEQVSNWPIVGYLYWKFSP